MSSFDKKFDYLKIPLKNIQIATNNFAHENIIGRDGFGNEYKGQLLDLKSGQLIDIVARRLDYRRGQGIKEFQTEIMMLSSLKHQNLVSIVGYCDEGGEKIIVNKFEANGRLDQCLHDPVTLTWTQRLRICLGIARALSYIHYDKERSFSVIHRDVKCSKILLDDKWEPKLSGVELSTMQPATQRLGLVFDDACGTLGSRSFTPDIDRTRGRAPYDERWTRSRSIERTGDCRGFAFVRYKYADGREVDGREITVQFAKYGPNAERIHKARIFEQKRKKARSKASSKKEYSRLALKPTSTNLWKGKDLEHLRIGFDTIKKAKENFNKKYWIGSGGYGEVYTAELEHFDSSVTKGEKESQLPKKRSTVAIKCITIKEDTQGEQGFIAEIETLSTCMHPNIVSLLGFCHEPPHMILVYELLSNGSLDDYLETKGKMTTLTWVQRIKICIDIARGLNYIHTVMENKHKIIHRDIKSANILLDDTWKAKIADFGLSKLHPLDHMASTIKTNQIAGTPLYMDPEYERTGKLKKESDVYSFGVVLFEIMSGRLAYDPVFTNENEKGLAPIVRQHYEKGTIKELVDPALNEESTFTLSKGPNQDSLKIFSVIGYKCLAEKQVHRPSIQIVIKELEKALKFQETHIDNLQISFEDIRLATQNFKDIIGRGGFGNVYKGEILHVNGRYCNEDKEKILVYEYASKRSLDMLLKDASLTWTQRLKIGIDVANGLDFLHGGVYFVIHRDIKSSNILLTDNWNAKITDFGLSVITTVNNDIDFVVDSPCDTFGYIDPKCITRGFVTTEGDIYPFGVSIKDNIMQNSLITYQRIAYECLLDDIGKRPTTSELADVEIWEAKLPKDYKEIVGMSKTPEIYYNLSNKDLYEMFSEGILLKKGKVCVSVTSNSERNEMVLATMFSFENNALHNKRISFQTSSLCEDDEWMMVELCRFIPHKKDVEFKVLLQSLSRHYCGNSAIYVEGIHFRAINDATFKVKPIVDDQLNGAQRFLESNSDSMQQTSLDYDETTQLEDDEKLFSLGKANVGDGVLNALSSSESTFLYTLSAHSLFPGVPSATSFLADGCHFLLRGRFLPIGPMPDLQLPLFRPLFFRPHAIPALNVPYLALNALCRAFNAPFHHK
ncbi:hypothetical protein R6Q59_027710 [Mikania micrantha]